MRLSAARLFGRPYKSERQRRDYSNAEPGAGFEQRILRHVHSAPMVRRLWPNLLPALVAIAIVIVFLHRDSPKTEPSPQIIRTVETPPQAMPSQPVVKRRNLPARKPFAEPEPLTAEERALLRFVQDRPDLAREALSQSAHIEEITIEPLKIEEIQ